MTENHRMSLESKAPDSQLRKYRVRVRYGTHITGRSSVIQDSYKGSHMEENIRCVTKCHETVKPWAMVAVLSRGK